MDEKKTTVDVTTVLRQAVSLLDKYDNENSDPYLVIATERKGQGFFAFSVGRIVIPREMCNFLQINMRDDLEILLTTDGILLRKPGYVVQKIECENKP